jgi:hypothetical protein
MIPFCGLPPFALVGARLALALMLILKRNLPFWGTRASLAPTGMLIAERKPDWDSESSTNSLTSPIVIPVASGANHCFLS